LIQVEIAVRVRQRWVDTTLLRRVALHAAAAEAFEAGALSIAVVGARAMAALHARSMNIPSPTDVLTFDLGTSRRRRILDGEIVVCSDVAKAAAQQRTSRVKLTPSRSRKLGTTPAAELALYVCHGVLHLAGYSDVALADYRHMHLRENELLAQLSLGQVFGDIIE
jgi:probable rRNA maturation factor